MGGHSDSAAIISRMQELRSTGLADVNELHAQAERVTDWREHVKAQPVLSVIAAAVVGYSLVKTVSPSNSPNQPTQNVSSTPSTARASASMGVFSLVGGVASSVARQWLTAYLKKQLGGYAHAADQSTSAEQRSHSNS